MPALLPFAGLRPDPTVAGPLADLVCPPYDVISEAERAELLRRSPYNVVRVELPAGDYQGAAALLREWKALGVLAREPAPALYGYKMTYKGPDGQQRATVGVIGALVLEPPGQGILPHEQTTPKAKSDRLELLRATSANTSPIWCLCSQPGLAAAIGDPDRAQEAGASAVDDAGVVHELWPLPSPEVHEAVAATVAAHPLLVADGHHRYETALAYHAEQVGAGKTDGGHGAVLALVVELSEEHLQVLAIHRVVSGLPGGADLLAAFRQDFEILAAQAQGEALIAEMAEAGAACVVTSGGAFLAVPRRSSSDGGLALDSSRVDAVLSRLPAHEVRYEHDVPAALAEVRTGAADAAVLCRPATVGQIAATARGGERMPPKTTFFWPKPRTGMVLRDW